MLKKYDFVFVYEVKNRELEYICLLRKELEKRGYSVKFIETWEQEFYKTKPPKAEVTVGYSMYNDAVMQFVASHVADCKKFVNMQCEQIYVNATKNIDVSNGEYSFGISGLAKNAVHVSWGKSNYNRLVKQYGVKQDNVFLTGNISHDFLSKQFRDYYENEDTIRNKYNIPKDKKICLFISSFAWINIPESLLDEPLYKNQGFDVKKFCEASKDSQRIILEWLETFVKERTDYIIIYRPHPAENNNPLIEKLRGKYDNFKIIGEYSIRQWILISDKIFAWYSTSLCEVYAAGKKCDILRPVMIDYEADTELYTNAKFVTSYENFKKCMDQEQQFPLDDRIIDEMIYIDDKEPVYVKICNMLEKVYNSKMYEINIQTNNLSDVKRIVKNILRMMYRRMLRSKRVRNILRLVFPNVDERFEQYNYCLKMLSNNKTEQHEIDTIMSKLTKILD